MRDSNRTLLRSALFEAAFVVLGVVLALAANEWRESVERQRRADAALEEIVAELAANREVARTSLDYHETLLDTLRAHRGQPWAPSMALFSRGFVFPAQLDRTAWASAAETGALANMEYPTVLRLSRAYARQESYADQSRAIGGILYGELYHRGPGSIVANHSNLASLINAFAYRERQLVQAYDSTLAGVGR